MPFVLLPLGSLVKHISSFDFQASEYYLTAVRFADSPAMEAAGLDKSWPLTLR